MPLPTPDQTRALIIGVDVGGTFTDLVALDRSSGELHVIKLPSTPPEFHHAVLEAIARASSAPSPGTPGEGRGEGDFENRTALDVRNHPHPSPLPVYRERGPEGEGTGGASLSIVHGSTVATNALLQRAGEPVAFITTEGFRDMLLIGRQNRPNLYALRVERPAPITAEQNWFTVRERVDARGNVIEPLKDDEIDRLVRAVQKRQLKHAAVCLLFSFVNPSHEQRIGAALEAAGVTVSLSSAVLPEFREYERASTTAINASLRPIVRAYLEKLPAGVEPLCRSGEDVAGRLDQGPAMPSPAFHGLRIMHSGGGTLSVHDAAIFAAKLVLSGPAGGVIGAGFVARAAGFSDVITYDMGGTSTDVALVLGGEPQWTTGGVVDGLPIGLPAFDIHTVGAGGGSIAMLDAGGALRVGPKSAGAVPGPACYGRGGEWPTVTDANVVLARIVPDQFLGGGMRIEPDLAVKAIQPLATAMGKSLIEAALGIVKVSEANMASAIRAVTSQRGHDPRSFSLVSFGGAGGLHACALAEALEIPRVIVPPYCGVLSALGMVVAKPLADASKTVVQFSGMDDARLAMEFDSLDAIARAQMPDDETARVERFADVRFRGQSYEVKVPVEEMSIGTIGERFKSAYAALNGMLPQRREIEIVTLRLRRVGHGTEVSLPTIAVDPATSVQPVELIDSTGQSVKAAAFTRGGLIAGGSVAPGPLLLIDATATAYIPHGWNASARPDGSVIAERNSSPA